MSRVKCFDVANMVIEDATDRFKPIYQIHDEHFSMFKQYCDAIDSLASEFDGVSYEVNVDEITMEVTVLLECAEIVVESRNHVLYELFDRTVRYGFSVSDDGNLIVKFVFPTLWCRA